MVNLIVYHLRPLNSKSLTRKIVENFKWLLMLIGRLDDVTRFRHGIFFSVSYSTTTKIKSLSWCLNVWSLIRRVWYRAGFYTYMMEMLIVLNTNASYGTIWAHLKLISLRSWILCRTTLRSSLSIPKLSMEDQGHWWLSHLLWTCLRGTPRRRHVSLSIPL